VIFLVLFQFSNKEITHWKGIIKRNSKISNLELFHIKSTRVKKHKNCCCRACWNHTWACRNHTHECGNHTRAYLNHTLRVETTLGRVFWKVERVLSKKYLKIDTHAHFHTFPRVSIRLCYEFCALSTSSHINLKENVSALFKF
jgi:hypothetical protein